MGSEVIVFGAYLPKFAKTHQTKAKTKPIIKNTPTNVQKVMATACVHAPKDSGYHCAMEAFLVSTGIVALAEMGDKTQLLALILAVRFRKPWPIVLGIWVATLANHGLAGAVGAWLTTVLGPLVLRWVLGASFIAMAVWMLIPDKMEDEDANGAPRFGVFGTTVIAFFLAEMGDKTQVATVMLAARFHDYFSVVAGTTLGMMLANAPVVWLGERMTRLVPLRTVHLVSACIFFGLGLLALLG